MEIITRLSSRKHDKEARSAEDEASPFSYFFFLFLNPLFAKGSRETLEMADLGHCSQQDRTDLLYERFCVHWSLEEALPIEQRSLWRPLFKTVGIGKFCFALFLYTLYSAEQFGPVLILNYLVDYFQDSRDLSTGALWALVSLMFVLPMAGSIVAAHSNAILVHIGLQFRNILVNKIYRKALLLSPAARQVSSTGQIVNMFSSDTVQLQRFLFFVNNIFMAIPTIGVALYLIYRLVGVATFVGLGMIIITMPLNGVIFGTLNLLRKEKMLVTDYRVKLMNEVLAGIRILKFYAWENAFIEKITVIRQKELLILKKMAYLVAIAFTFILQAVPVFMPVLIFYTYVRLGHTLDSAKAFTAISLFNLMQFPFVFLPLGLSQYSQSLVSLKRLIQFFAADELKSYLMRYPRSDGLAVHIQSATLGWVQEGELANMDMLRSTLSKKEKDEKDKLKKNKEQEEKNLKQKEEVAGLDNVDLQLMDTEEGVQGNGPNRSVETLRDLNISIRRGELVAVVGPVGCGKSSFLNSLLGEMNLLSGEVHIDGSVAYCDQRPWILNDSVEGNILFGREMNEARFDSALYASCLEEDIKILPGGLQTQIGEKGINLSGGQKARVALARAVYRDADIYLLDDPLSAVDAHVAQFLFHECVRRALAGKTRILVTHHVHLLPHCDRVIVLVDGEVKVQGTYAEVVESGIDLSQLATKPKEAEEEDEKVVANPVLAASKSEEERNKMAYVSPSEQSEESEAERNEMTYVPPFQTNEENKAEENQQERDDEAHYTELRKQAVEHAEVRKTDTRQANLITKEDRKEGDVTLACYNFYIRAGGIGRFFAFLVSMLVGQAFTLLASYWLQYWGTRSVDRKDDNDPFSARENVWYLSIYAALSAANLVFYMFRSLFLAEHRMGTSAVLHKGLLRGTMNAPVAFFDTNPVGRILNRFSSDLLTVDEELSQSLSQLSNGAASVIGAIGAISGATKGTFLILMVPLSYFYYVIQKYFRSTNTAIARIESISRSPIYADFSQALVGMSTIRAYEEEERFVLGLEKAVNANSVANIFQQLASQWLAIRLDLIGSLISFFIAAIAAATSGFIPAGFVALGLSYSFQMTTFLKFLVRFLATLEAQMNSVERVMQYMNDIAQEDQVLPDRVPVEPPASWPEHGVVEAKGLEMRYRDGPLVLKNINFMTNSCEKVGIAGRTGSGKSSLMIALFRIQELAGGAIFIDGIDTGSVPLSILRSRLGIIPQDPVMFSASVRFNLDPFDQYCDDEIWEVLEGVNMKDHVLSLPNRLDEDVAEGGDNFSVGQRQLICIGRAILRKPKILVLDEATASIDNENDNMIQQMVRQLFKQCTVLTIAHRLNTIIDSDRVMVLDQGELKELDSPANLLAVNDGMFKMLWEKHLRSHSGTAHETHNNEDNATDKR
eukprot:gene3955-4327_t